MCRPAQQSMLPGELVRVRTADGVELHGFYSASGPRTELAVYYIHPWTANFYRVAFPSLIGHNLQPRGYSYLSLNTRGHDVRSTLYQYQGRERRFATGGAAYERFEDCLLDLAAGIDWLEGRGHQRVVMLGYSMGATKCAYYLTQRADSRVIAAVWISPWDVYSFRSGSDLLGDAQRLVGQGQGDSLLPFIFETVISAQTYVNFCGPEARTGLFSLHQPDQAKALGNLTIPILTVLAEEGELIVGETARFLRELHARLIRAPRRDSYIVRSSDHLHVGFEDELVRVVGDWVLQLAPP